MAARGPELAKDVLEAVMASVDRERLARALDRVVPSSPPSSGSAPAGNKTATAVLHRIVLSDILDDAILSARPGETSFPLRMFFGALGDGLADDTAFALASGLNFYFRVGMDEEAKMRVGIEVSALYYKFVEDAFERDVVVQLSPLLARLMSTELERLRFESIDGAGMFDSSIHERVPGSDSTGARIRSPKSFLCRVVSTSMVRSKALVST
jgi:hypothetical protein